MPRHSGLLATAAVAAVLAAAPLQAAAADPPTTITPAVVLGIADSGSTVTVHPGDVVEASLPSTVSGSVMWVWSPPRSSDSDVLPLMPLPVPPFGVAFFRAGKPGKATVTSTQSCRPVAPSTTCPFVAVQWSATVVVS